jgi:hypothetical protein
LVLEVDLYANNMSHISPATALYYHKYEVVGLVPTAHRLPPRKICGYAGLAYTLTECMTITSYWKHDSMLLHVTTQPGMSTSCSSPRVKFLTSDQAQGTRVYKEQTRQNIYP